MDLNFQIREACAERQKPVLALKARYSAAQGRKPWEKRRHESSTARATQAFCAALAELILFYVHLPGVEEHARRALESWALLHRAFSAAKNKRPSDHRLYDWIVDRRCQAHTA